MPYRGQWENRPEGRQVVNVPHGKIRALGEQATATLKGCRLRPPIPSVRTDARNAGAKEWVDGAVVSDSANGYTLVTSRTPKDLEDFLGAVNKALVGS